MNEDEKREIVMAALKANTNRPELLPLVTEGELDAYVCGFEQAARLVAAHIGYDIRLLFD